MTEDHPPEPTSPEPTSPEPPDLTSLAEQVAALRASVDELAAAVGRDHERAAFRESVVDRLHAENQELRRGELERLLAPVRGGLFRLHDRARQAAAQCRAAEDLTPRGAAALLDTVADEAVDVLLGVGVEQLDTQPGEAYDPSRHRPVGTVPVAEASRHHTVVEVRKAGFTTAEKTIRRADVVVAKHEGEEQP